MKADKIALKPLNCIFCIKLEVNFAGKRRFFFKAPLIFCSDFG